MSADGPERVRVKFPNDEVATSRRDASAVSLLVDLLVLPSSHVRLRVAASRLTPAVSARLGSSLSGLWSELGGPPGGHVVEPLAGLPYNDELHAVEAAAAAGDLHFSFLIGSALLERLLNELVGGGGRAGLLLKDLIAHKEVERRLGACAVAWLSALFSPSSLNLRNLIWHGFLAPRELEQRHAASLLRLLSRAAAALGAARRAEAALWRPPAPCWDPKEADASLGGACGLLDAAPTFPPPPADGCCLLCLTSPMCRVGHAESVRRGLSAYRRRRHLEPRDFATFACLVLPALEAGLRGSFVLANPAEASLGAAHVGAYFSTLDGWGQRSKHQLLLAPHLHSDGSPNRLLAWLGDGMHALLLDLFLHAAGPGLRAKFAHGEAALLPAASPPTDEGGEAEAGGEAGGEAGEAERGVPVAMRLLHAAFLSLCAASHSPESLAELRREAPALEASGRLARILGAAARLRRRYQSQCDPRVLLARARARARGAVERSVAEGRLYAVRRRASRPPEEEGPAGADCEVTCPAGGGTLTLVLACAVRPADVAALRRASELSDKVRAALDALSSRGAPGPGCAPGCEAGLVECSRRAVLRLSGRFCELESTRLRGLAERAAARRASTSQRRSLLVGCESTLALRRLAELALALEARHPLREASAGEAGEAGGQAPLQRLHAWMDSLCAAHEAGKVGQLVEIGTTFVEGLLAT